MGISNWGLAWTSLMPIALILYYFYRKKYIDQPVSSILYWRELLKEIQASPYLKKLQHHALFYLQLAALLLLVLALLNPYIKSEGLEGGEIIFVIDTSASMLAGSPSRLEQQKALMKELAAKAQGKSLTIINAGSTPEILAKKEKSLSTLENVIDEIEAGYEADEMEKTLFFAETLLEGDSGAIHIFTDALDRQVVENKTGAAYTVHAIREKSKNVSIRQFGVAQGESEDRAIVQLVNDSEMEVSATLELIGEDFDTSTEIRLDAGEEVLVPFENLPKAGLWQANLIAADDYSLDNRSYAYANASADSVVIDNALHGLVARGVESLGVRANVAPAEQLGKFSGVPLITNQSGLLEAELPVLLIGRNDEPAFEVAGPVETGNHALFAYAPMESVFVSALYPAFENFETLATVGGYPFIQQSPAGDIIVLADLQATDWPLSPSFPLFLWSAINELTGDEQYLGTFRPKEQRAVPLTSETGEWEIFKGDEYQFSYIESNSHFQSPAEPGLYRAGSGDDTKNFIVQLDNEEKVLPTGQNYSTGKAVETEKTAELSVMPWLVLAVLVLMLAEWEVYRRGTSF